MCPHHPARPDRHGAPAADFVRTGAAPALAGFDTKLRANGAFQVSYRTGQSSVEQVLAAVRASGVHIKDIATEDPDLEDVFLALTYGDPNAADPTKD